MRRVLVVAALAAVFIATAAVAQSLAPSHDPAVLTTAPRDYEGIRLDRHWTSADTPKSFGNPASFVNAPLPDNASLDAASNPAVPNEVQSQASTYGTYLNRWDFTAPLTRVPTTQPLTPVRCVQSNGANCASAVYQMMLGVDAAGNDLHGGLPIPDDYVESPTTDTDAEAVFYQPDYVQPCSGQKVGRFYEAWKLRPNLAYDAAQPISPVNPKWRAQYGGRVVGAQNSNGHYVDWMYSGCHYQQPGHPDSTYQSHYWGVLASGLFIVNDEISREDCALGQINHAIGLLMVRTKPGQRWPAQRNDGSVSYVPVLEGMRLRFSADMPRPQFSSDLAGMIFDAAQKYGLVVSDNTASNVAIRVESNPDHTTSSECAARMAGVAGYDVLKDFPWSQLRVLATGSDANPTPTS